MTDDPFANLNSTDSGSTATVEAPADDAAAYFLAEMTIGDEEFEAPAPFIPYTRPPKNAWVPVRIVSSQVNTRDARVVVKNESGEESIEEVSLDRFELEADHVADCYGERNNPYLLGTPAFDVTLPYRNGPKRGKLGWDKKSGRKLLAATRVAKPGQRITPESLPELAEAMADKIVMAQIRYVEKEYTDSEPMTRADGSFIKCKVDKHGTQIKVVKNADGAFVLEEGDVPFNGHESELIEINGGYLITDNSEDGAIVKELTKRTVIFDNLQDDVAPVPNRKVTITRTDGSEVEGEITWNTVGQVVTKPMKAGTQVTVAVEGTGELVPVSWVGTTWSEVPAGGGMDVFKGE